MQAVLNYHPSDRFNFKTKPFQHQIDSFNFAFDQQYMLLGDDLGLGKTKQAIDIAISRKLWYGLKHCIIVTGVSDLKYNWEDEIKIHSDESGYILGRRFGKRGKEYNGSIKDRLEDLNKLGNEIKDFFIITNVETLKKHEVQVKMLELTRSGMIGMAVIDEFHKCNNFETSVGKSIHCLETHFRMAMTGTPVMNHPTDLYNILRWLKVEQNSAYWFKRRYCTLGGRSGDAVVGYQNLKELRKKVERIMIRRKKGDVLDLPPKMRKTEYMDMTPKQEQLYTEVLNQIRANIHNIKLNPNPLAMLTRLRQVTAHPELLSNTITESVKFDRMEELVNEIVESGQSVVIYSNWREVIKLVEKRLQKYDPAIVVGGKRAKQEIDRFVNDEKCQVIAGTIRKLGTGWTLTKAKYVIFLDKPWNPGNRDQAEDRAYRIGTDDKVYIITLACSNSIDERIEEIIYKKEDIIEALIEGDEDKIDQLHRDQVKKLVDSLIA